MLSVLGPQKSSYLTVATADLPAGGTIFGVAALAPPRGSSKQTLVIVTGSNGFDTYTFKPSTGTLTLGSGAQLSSSLPIGGNPQFDISGDPAFSGAGFGTGPGLFSPPSLAAADQAPPTLNPYTLGGNGASTFAVGYLAPNGARNPGSPTTVVFGYDSGGLEPLVEFTDQGAATPGGMVTRYGVTSGTGEPPVYTGSGYTVARTNVFAATVPYGEAKNSPQMGPFDSWSSPRDTSGSNNSLLPIATIPCFGSPQSGPPTVSLDAQGSTAAATCAVDTGANAIQYIVTRVMQDGVVGGPDPSADYLSTSFGTESLPTAAAGSPVALSAQIDFPCDEFLVQFAAHPVNGYPPVTNTNYCQNGQAPNSTLSVPPDLEPAGTSAGAGSKLAPIPLSSVALSLNYLVPDSNGFALEQSNVSFPMESGCFYQRYQTANPCNGATAISDIMNLLQDRLTGSPSVATVPLDRSGVQLQEEVLADSSGQTLEKPATRNPVPVGLLAAPPYYAGAQQQVTPTSATFTNQGCTGSGSSQSNTVGVSVGVKKDVEVFGIQLFEAEAVASALGKTTISRRSPVWLVFDRGMLKINPLS